VVLQEMTEALALDVPLRVDVAAGPNWLDVTDLTTETQRTQKVPEKAIPVSVGAMSGDA
jgi:hypothetical protein